MSANKTDHNELKEIDIAINYLKTRLENRNIAISHKPFKVDISNTNKGYSISKDTIYLCRPRTINIKEIQRLYGGQIHESSHAKYTNLDYISINKSIKKFLMKYYSINEMQINQELINSAFDLINISEDYRVNTLLKFSHEGAEFIMTETHEELVKNMTFTTAKNYLLPSLLNLRNAKNDLITTEIEKLERAKKIIKPIVKSSDINISLKILPKVYEIFYPSRDLKETETDKNNSGDKIEKGKYTENTNYRPKTKEETEEIKKNVIKAIEKSHKATNEETKEETIKDFKKEIATAYEEIKKNIKKESTDNKEDIENLKDSETKFYEDNKTAKMQGLTIKQEIEIRDDKEVYNKIVTSNHSIITKMTNDFKTLFTVNEGYIKQQSNGKIDGKRIYKVFTNNKRIFKKKNDETLGDIAFLLLVDCSGSMGGHRIELARETAVIMHEILKKVNVKHMIVGFTADLNSIYHNRRRVIYNVINHIIFKTFDNDKTSYNLSNLQAYCNNRDGDSLRLAKTYFKGITERKVLIVISDGQPNAYDHAPNGKGLTDTINAQRELKKDGIKLINIGLQYEIPGQYINKIKIETLSELSKKLIGILKREISY
jgi:hypothetical protein